MCTEEPTVHLSRRSVKILMHRSFDFMLFFLNT